MLRGALSSLSTTLLLFTSRGSWMSSFCASLAAQSMVGGAAFYATLASAHAAAGAVGIASASAALAVPLGACSVVGGAVIAAHAARCAGVAIDRATAPGGTLAAGTTDAPSPPPRWQDIFLRAAADAACVPPPWPRRGVNGETAASNGSGGRSGDEVGDNDGIEYALKFSLCCVALFRLLGGRFAAVLPSDYCRPGAYADAARGSLPATFAYANGPDRAATAAFGRIFGCHTCGVRTPPRGSTGHSGFHADHAPPRKWAKQANARWWRRLLRRPVSQRFYPQCKDCSNVQGSLLSQGKRQLKLHFLSAFRPHHLAGAAATAAVWILAAGEERERWLLHHSSAAPIAGAKATK